MMLVAGNIRNFKLFSQFNDIEDFNNNIEAFLAEHKKDFTKSELIAFKRLVRYSAKVKGVANAKIGTLLKTINKKTNGFGISRSTFERMLRKAKKFGILQVLNTKKATGKGKGHNVYVFNCWLKTKIDVFKIENLTYLKNGEILDGKQSQEPFSKGKLVSLETNNIKNNNNVDVTKLDYRFVSSSVPEAFVEAVRPFFDRAVEIEKFWNRFVIAVRKWTEYKASDLVDNIAIKAFRQLVRKHNKVKNYYAFYFVTVRNMLQNYKNESNKEASKETSKPKRRIIRKEIKPDWLIELEKQEEQEQKQEQQQKPVQKRTKKDFAELMKRISLLE